jgi:hypothetical protein
VPRVRVAPGAPNKINGLADIVVNPFFFIQPFFTAILPLLEFIRVIFALADVTASVSPTMV